jgi:transmembrane sensor
MTTAKLTPDQVQIEAEASAWIVQLDGAEPSAADIEAFKEWLARSPAHRDAFKYLSTVWDDLNVLAELAVPRKTEVQKGRTEHSLLTQWVGMAAAIAAVSLLSVSAWYFVGQSSKVPQSVVESSPVVMPVRSGNFVTEVGQLRTIQLTDGSRIVLNTDSELIIDLNPAARNIYLVRGEALFSVNKDPSREFRVHAGGGLVRAIGTEFSVYLRQDNNVAVAVSDGVVELAVVSKAKNVAPEPDEEAPARPTLTRVSAGQIAVFGRDLESLQSVGIDAVSRQLSWRSGMLRFDGVALPDVVASISRYTNTNIIIASPALNDLRIGGYFKVGETAAMLEALESGFGVRVERIDAETVRLVEAP